MRLLYSLLMSLLTHIALAQTPRAYELQGHRGCRGLMPENTIPAFLKALELGVNTLEMDVVISQDGQVVVSHEPYFNADFTTKPDGSPVTKDEQETLVLYRMPYAEIKRYDVGVRGNARFPEQKRLKAQKPLLRDVFAAVEAYCAAHHVPAVAYNIELKSEPDQYDKSQPQPADFCRLVNQILTDAHIDPARITIQSFDFAVLQQWNQQAAAGKLLSCPLSALVENLRGIDYNLKKLGFKPAIYSPYYKLLGRAAIAKLHRAGLRVIPWTVNEPDAMRRMLDLGVDGLITDYPDRAIGL